MSKIGSSDSKTSLCCSFCGKSQHEVRKLIAGPTVFICDECVELCLDIIGEENNSLLRKSGDNVPTPKEIRKILDDDVQAKLDAFVANEDGRPGNELAHLILALAAERAVERVLRIAAANLAHSEPPSKTLPCSSILNVGHFVLSDICKIF